MPVFHVYNVRSSARGMLLNRERVFIIIVKFCAGAALSKVTDIFGGWASPWMLFY